MKDGDFIHLDYTGKIKENGIIFDTTKEEVAKKNNVYSQDVVYKPVLVIIGANLIFKVLEEEIKNMKTGENKTVEITPEKAFGHRKNELIRFVPISEFKGQNTEPVVGNFVSMKGISGKIINVSSGRVTIDFNHPLAGKNLVYELEIKDLIESVEGKVKAVISYFSGGDESKMEVSLDGKNLRVIVDKDRELPSDIRARIADIIRKWIDKFEKIEFVHVH